VVAGSLTSTYPDDAVDAAARAAVRLPAAEIFFTEWNDGQVGL